MLNIFRKKSEKEKLQDQYRNLMIEANKVSHVYRGLGDPKIKQAYIIRQILEKMD